MSKYPILYDFTLNGILQQARKAYRALQPRLWHFVEDIMKRQKRLRHYKGEGCEFYCKTINWFEKDGWHIFISATEFLKVEKRLVAVPCSPFAMRFVSDTDGNRYLFILRFGKSWDDAECYVFTLHFMRRFAERAMCCSSMAPLQGIAEYIALIFNEQQKVITTGTRYGCHEHRVCLVMGIGDGLGFGYEDTQANLFVVDTYIHKSMLRNNQHHVFDFLNDMSERNGEDFPIVMDGGQLRPMTEKELIEYVENYNNPEYREKIFARKQWEMQQNRKRWEKKSLRSSDSVQVKPRHCLPKTRPTKYNPYD